MSEPARPAMTYHTHAEVGLLEGLAPWYPRVPLNSRSPAHRRGRPCLGDRGGLVRDQRRALASWRWANLLPFSGEIRHGGLFWTGRSTPQDARPAGSALSRWWLMTHSDAWYSMAAGRQAWQTAEDVFVDLASGAASDSRHGHMPEARRSTRRVAGQHQTPNGNLLQRKNRLTISQLRIVTLQPYIFPADCTSILLFNVFEDIDAALCPTIAMSPGIQLVSRAPARTACSQLLSPADHHRLPRWDAARRGLAKERGNGFTRP